MHKTYLSKNLNSLFFAEPIILKEIPKTFPVVIMTRLKQIRDRVIPNLLLFPH